MKTKSILFTIFLGISLIGNSQIFIQAKTISTNSDSSTYVLSYLNKPGDHFIFSICHDSTNINADLNGFVRKIANKDTIKVVNSDNGLPIRFEISTKNNSTRALASCIPDFNKFQITHYKSPSSKNNYDGNINLNFTVHDSAKANLMYTFYNYETGDSTTYSIDSIGFNTFKMPQLGIGYLLMTFDQHVSPFITFSGFIGDYSNALTNNSLSIKINQTDAFQNCNGSIKLTPINAVGNVTYRWSNDSTVISSSQQNLCPGVYSILATDSNLKTTYLHVYITDNNYNYTDSSVYYITPDTSKFNFMNCQIDYNSPIDSLHYNEILVAQKNDTTKYKFDLTLFQGSHSSLLSDTLYVINDSSIFLNCVVFCQQLKSSTFSGKRISLVRKSKFASASINEIKSEPFSISPNPTENNITISGLKYNGDLFDITGQRVMKINSKTTSLSHLKDGIYLLKLDNNSKIYKIIKN